MIKIVRNELYNRLIILILCITIITIITIQYSNDLILWILNPIKEINNDFHNKIIYNMINKSYSIFDTEKKKEYITNIKIDYIPSYEISVKIEQIWNMTTKIIIHINGIWCIVIIYTQIIIALLPSIYKTEKEIIKRKYIYNITIIMWSIITTHTIWTQIYWQISLHNYYEYNYYEIDIMFDINNYINNYIKIIYITIIIIKIKKKKELIILIISTWLLKILNNIESIYIYLIWKFKNKIIIEKKKIKQIKNNMLQNLNKMEK